MAAEEAIVTGKRPKRERAYPMPCPGCGKMIDARDHLCPHCGIDTDAKLAPLRAALPIVAVLLVVGLVWAVKAWWPSSSSSESAIDTLRVEPSPVPRPVPVEQAEVEPDDTAEQAQTVTAPGAILGRLEAGDRDFFRVEVPPPGAKRLFAGFDGTGVAGATLRVIGEDQRVRGEAVTPERIAAVGVRPGSYWLGVEAGPDGGGDYRLSIAVEPASAGDEWEPDDDATHPSPLAPFRAGGGIVAGGRDAGPEAAVRTLGHTAGRGWWSRAVDPDCFELPNGFRAAAEIEVEIQPPPRVTARLWVMDAVDPATSERRLLAASTAAEPGVAHRLSVGIWPWKTPMVACVAAAAGTDYQRPYRIAAEVLASQPERPIELEPNDERRKAQHVPPGARVRGQLPPGDIDQFVLEPRPEGEQTVTLAPTRVAARLVLLDAAGAELASAESSADVPVELEASGIVYALLDRSGAAAPADPGAAGETGYQLELGKAPAGSKAP